MKLSPTIKSLLRGVLAIALVMGLGVAALLWQASRTPGDYEAAPSALAPNDVTPPEPQPDQMMRMLQGEAAGDFSLLPPGAKPREGLPLDLPLFSETGQTPLKLTSYEIDDAGLVEQVAIWSLPGAEAERVMAFYNDQLRQAGFAPPSEYAATPHNRLYHRDDQALLLRVRSAGANIRLTILLRYTRQ